MDFIRLLAFLSFIIVSVSLSQAEETSSIIGKEKNSKIEARQRTNEIDDLKKELEAEQVVSHEYYVKTSAGNVILLDSTVCDSRLLRRYKDIR
jgi:hypothetical protein